MIRVGNWGPLALARDKLSLLRPRVSRVVVYLGLTSLFTDISAEMVNTVLPIYLVLHLGFTPLAFGFIDGLYQGAGALLRLASGMVSDSRGRHKEVAVAGYGLSAVCKLGLVAAGNVWGALAATVFLDRAGKGVRTAPRDALISLNTPKAELATAFGVHRALDNFGGMVGPLSAFALLALLPGAFDVVFVASFCVAVVGVGVLALFVENPPRDADVSNRKIVSFRLAFGLLKKPRYRALVIAGAALSVLTLSDGFIYLALQRRLNFNAGYVPLLFVATAAAYLLLAVPAGRVADRVGRERVFFAGYLLMVLVYATLLLPGLGFAGLAAAVLLLGAYYALTEGVLMALTSAVVPTDLRASGLGLMTTGTNAGRLLASVLFGALWTWWGTQTAALVFAVGLIAAIVVAAVALVPREQVAVDEPAGTA